MIPAYKAAFLRQVLESVANQTCHEFRLYIGDDASPEEIADIVHEFSGTFRDFARCAGILLAPGFIRARAQKKWPV